MGSPRTHDDPPEQAATPAPATPPVAAPALPDLDDAAAILALQDLQFRWVDVPEWGVRAYVRSLMGSERDAFEVAMIETRGKSRVVNLKNLRARLVAASIRKPSDPEQRVFSEAQITALGQKNAAALQRVFKVAQELSGLADDEVDELADALGNDQSAASGSA